MWIVWRVAETAASVGRGHQGTWVLPEPGVEVEASEHDEVIEERNES